MEMKDMRNRILYITLAIMGGMIMSINWYIIEATWETVIWLTETLAAPNSIVLLISIPVLLFVIIPLVVIGAIMIVYGSFGFTKGR